MPLPALIAAGLPILGGIAQGIFNAGQNRSQQKFALSMYDKQRADALADWNMQNQYNSPAQQMQRFKEAGLNPNLIYGQQTTAPSVRSSETPRWNPNSYNISGPVNDSIAAYQNTRITEAQLKNLELDAAIKTSDNILKQKQAANLDIKSATSQYDLDRAKSNRAMLDEYQRLVNEKLQAGNVFTLAENERKEVMQASNLKEAVQRVLESRSRMATSEMQRRMIERQIRMLDYDLELKEYDKKLRSSGVDPRNSPWWLKTVADFIQKTSSGFGYGALSTDSPGMMQNIFGRPGKPGGWRNK